MPVAPTTFLSFAIWVSVWMLRSFMSVSLSVSPPGFSWGEAGFGTCGCSGGVTAVGSA